MTKIKGTVKWFSNRKGFGFIAPTSDNSPTKEEIFVHQTSIFSDGEYRTLVDGTEVEFEVEKEESGKLKAVNVTSPGGAAIKPPSRERKRRPRKGKKGEDDGESGDEDKEVPAAGEETNGDQKDKDKGKGRNRRNKGAKKPDSEGDVPKKEREPPFHDVISEDAKKKIAEKGIELGQKMTIDVAIGEARVKLGQGGYAGLAHATGMIGEGTYKCDDKGLITFEWERCVTYADGKWVSSDKDKLMKTLSLSDDGIGPVKPDETAESLWGADKADPKDAFAELGFKMKRVVLTRPPGGRGRRRGRPGKPNGGKKE